MYIYSKKYFDEKNPDLIRNQGAHCFSDSNLLMPVPENPDDPLTLDITIEFTRFIHNLYYQAKGVMFLCVVGFMIFLCNSNPGLWFLKMLQSFLMVAVMAIFIHITRVRFSTAGRVCSGEFETILEDQIASPMMYESGNFIQIAVFAFWGTIFLAIIIPTIVLTRKCCCKKVEKVENPEDKDKTK